MKILLADDHVLFRSGMRLVLEDLSGDVQIFEAGSFDTVRQEMTNHPDLDLALVDLDMPGMNEWEGVQALAQAFPEIPFVMVSGSETREHVVKAIDSGAMGYIPKTLGSDVMLAALKLVLSGGIYLPPTLLDEGMVPHAVQAMPDEVAVDNPDAPRLTRRQHDVLRLLALGKSNKEIARELDLAEGTVKIHVSGVIAALGCNNRTEAVATATRLGLVDIGA